MSLCSFYQKNNNLFYLWISSENWKFTIPWEMYPKYTFLKSFWDLFQNRSMDSLKKNPGILLKKTSTDSFRHYSKNCSIKSSNIIFFRNSTGNSMWTLFTDSFEHFPMNSFRTSCKNSSWKSSKKIFSKCTEDSSRNFPRIHSYLYSGIPLGL